MVSTIKINACNVITRIWKMDQANDNTNCARPNVTELVTEDEDAALSVSHAINIKISSPAYRFPNNRSDKEIGFAINPTNSNNKLKGINKG